MSTATLALVVGLPLLFVAVALTLLRLLRGPNLGDRVVALDLMITLGIGLIGVYAIATGQPALLDVAIVVALLAFLGTVAFTLYLNQLRIKN